MNQKSSRRRFLQTAVGGFGGLVAGRVAGLFPEAQPLLAQATQDVIPVSHPIGQEIGVGELYAGFILLSDSTSLPTFVLQPIRQPPTICGAGQINPEITGTARYFTTIETMASMIETPIYTLASYPDFIQPGEKSFIQYNSGEIFDTSIVFDIYDEFSRSWIPIIHFRSQPDYLRPFPLWEAKPVEADGPMIILEKTNDLPTPGIKIVEQEGAIFYWIEDDVLNTLRIGSSLEAFESDILKSLLRIR
jgi:hypothetical protein